jgi:hypothetical protein
MRLASAFRLASRDDGAAAVEVADSRGMWEPSRRIWIKGHRLFVWCMSMYAREVDFAAVLCLPCCRAFACAVSQQRPKHSLAPLTLARSPNTRSRPQP